VHGLGPASAWIERFGPQVRPGGSVLDLACGHGRHLRWFAERGHRVCGVDRDPAAIDAIGSWGEALLADLEGGPWPLADRRFDAVIVTNYLWRPLLPAIVDAVAENGLLLYETFAVGNETVGKPSRPDFLLRTGELLDVCRGLRVIAYEDGFLTGPDRFVQRIAAVREGAGGGPSRHAL
jgi:SAM-dependent methyltransferase